MHLVNWLQNSVNMYNNRNSRVLPVNCTQRNMCLIIIYNDVERVFKITIALILLPYNAMKTTMLQQHTEEVLYPSIAREWRFPKYRYARETIYVPGIAGFTCVRDDGCRVYRLPCTLGWVPYCVISYSKRKMTLWEIVHNLASPRQFD